MISVVNFLMIMGKRRQDTRSVKECMGPGKRKAVSLEGDSSHVTHKLVHGVPHTAVFTFEMLTTSESAQRSEQVPILETP
jgi:hypothetical protein